MVHYGRALLHLAKASGSAGDGTEAGFTATGSGTFADHLTLARVFSVCLQENEKRMSSFDDRLLPPNLLPKLSVIALRVLSLLPQKQPANRPEVSVSE